MTSIGLRPGLLFFSFTGVNTAASISARKLSNGTTRAIISSGSPFAVIAASRRSASKNPNCPIVSTPANLVVTNQTRTNSRRSLFFEVPTIEFYFKCDDCDYTSAQLTEISSELVCDIHQEANSRPTASELIACCE